ncbi:MAG: hypothetical protein Q8N40_06785 [Bradyrhizobium sp.]|nr:hypothetical protein [Bradyrhizobium sp.]
MIRPSLIPALFAMPRRLPAGQAQAVVEKIQSHDRRFTAGLAKPNAGV